MKLGKRIVRLLQYMSVKFDASSSLRSEVITKMVFTNTVKVLIKCLRESKRYSVHGDF